MSEPDVLIVQADSADSSLGWATLGDRRWRCTVGAGGVREDKVEGDAATPAGIFPLRRLYFRNDRLVLPKVGLPARPINQHDGWGGDPAAGATIRGRRPTTGWSAFPTTGATRRCGARTGSTTSSWWWATTTTRPKANGAAPSSSTSPVGIMRRPRVAL